MIIFLSVGCGSSGGNGKKPLNIQAPVSNKEGVMVTSSGANIFFLDSNGDYSAYIDLNNYGFSSEKGDSSHYKGFRGEKGIFVGICNHSDISRERILYFDTKGNFQNVSINPHEYIQNSMCGALIGTFEGYLILYGDADFSEFQRVNKFFLFDEKGNLIDEGNAEGLSLAIFKKYTFDRGQLYSGEFYELIQGGQGMTLDPSYGVNPFVLPDRSSLHLGFTDSGKVGITQFDENGQFMNGVILSDLLNGQFGTPGGGIVPILDGRFAIYGNLNGNSVIALFNKDASLEKTIDVSAFTPNLFASNGSGAIMLSGPESAILKSATALSTTSVKIEWEDKSQSEDGFGIERTVGTILNIESFKLVANIGSDETSYVDAGLLPNTTYWYRVFPYRGKYKQGYSSISSIKTPQ